MNGYNSAIFRKIKLQKLPLAIVLLGLGFLVSNSLVNTFLLSADIQRAMSSTTTFVELDILAWLLSEPGVISACLETRQGVLQF